jgi:signal recognition particle receptor subunit beta
VTFINYAAREINCKLVYYGPGLGGKTTNVQYIYERSAQPSKGKLISLATESDRTLFFDFMPLELGTIRGFRTRFHLYTVPGQVFYDASRKIILKGVDGVVFVADSQEARYEANLESLRNLRENLVEHARDLRTLPYVLQLNKRDTPTAMPADTLASALRLGEEPVFEAVAVQGLGVFESLKAAIRRMLLELRKS